MRSAHLLLAALAVAVLTGCGTPSADLFVVERDGMGPGARLTLRVGDGGEVSCNGGARRALGSERLLDARELARELSDEAKRGLALPAGAGAVFSYRIRLEHGAVSFSDRSPGLPPAFQRMAAFTRDVSRRVCRLAR